MQKPLLCSHCTSFYNCALQCEEHTVAAKHAGKKMKMRSCILKKCKILFQFSASTFFMEGILCFELATLLFWLGRWRMRFKDGVNLVTETLTFCRLLAYGKLGKMCLQIHFNRRKRGKIHVVWIIPDTAVTCPKKLPYFYM